MSDTDASVIAALRAEVEELKRQLGLANQALDGMRERDSRHRAEVERLTRELETARHATSALLKQRDEAKDRAEQAERERDEAQEAAAAAQFSREAFDIVAARAERLRSESEHLCNLIERYADDEHDGWLGMDVRSQIERVRSSLSEEER